MLLPEEAFKRANAELDRIAKELGLSGEVVNDARAELLKQLHADPFLRASRLQCSGLPTSTLLFIGPLKTVLQKVGKPRAALISEWLSASSQTAHAG